MTRKVVEIIERQLERRNFLRRAALVTGAFIGGLLVAPTRATAKPANGCCGLCFTPGSPPWPGNCACMWCWVCKYPVDCFKYKCMECFMSFAGNCTPQLCKCHNTDVRDACFTCNGVVASAKAKLSKYTPCTPL